MRCSSTRRAVVTMFSGCVKGRQPVTENGHSTMRLPPATMTQNPRTAATISVAAEYSRESSMSGRQSGRR